MPLSKAERKERLEMTAQIGDNLVKIANCLLKEIQLLHIALENAERIIEEHHKQVYGMGAERLDEIQPKKEETE